MNQRVRRSGLTAGLLCLLAGCILPGNSQAAPAPIRAHITEVDSAFIRQGGTPIDGAGIRFFDDSLPSDSGKEQFAIHWYANPPGIPPGAVILLETIQEREASVRNHTLKLRNQSVGTLENTIEIPASEIRRAGQVRHWRVRIVWRGKVLASRNSPDWETGASHVR